MNEQEVFEMNGLYQEICNLIKQKNILLGSNVAIYCMLMAYGKCMLEKYNENNYLEEKLTDKTFRHINFVKAIEKAIKTQENYDDSNKVLHFRRKA